MQKNKIGIIFVAAVLSLTGIGISFAGFTDVINIYGEVSTATVDFVIKEYSCTYVWKIYNVIEDIEEFEHFSVNAEKEIAIYQGPCIDPDQFEITVFQGKCDYERVAWAEAKPGDQDNEVDIEYSDLFPCIDFIGDVVIHYQGTIPGKIQWPEIIWESGDDLSDYVTIKTYKYTKLNDVYVKGDEIPMGDYPYQVHYCDHVGWDILIHLPQENTLQEKSGEFSFIIYVIQWNECSQSAVDTDGDGIPDDQDNCPDTYNPGQEDSDSDGTGDVCDNCPNDPYKTEPGTCGCGIPDTDTDNDGTPDCNDLCPNDPDKTAPGVCGCGVADTDTDGDGVADCVDNCVNAYNPGQEDTDGDGIGDACDVPTCLDLFTEDFEDGDDWGAGIGHGAWTQIDNDQCTVGDHGRSDSNLEGRIHGHHITVWPNHEFPIHKWAEIGIDTTGYDNVVISYYSKASGLSSTDSYVYFFVSYNGGTSWQVILSTANHEWTQRNHDLSTITGGACDDNPDIVIRFGIYAYIADYFYIDNVVINACEIAN